LRLTGPDLRPLQRWARATSRHVLQLPRQIAARTGAPTTREDLTLPSTAGYLLHARWVRSANGGPAPALVVSPAIHQGRAGLDSLLSPVTADELARLGYQVLVFDPAGRGDSWGEDDFGGPEHADDVRVMVRHALAREDVPWVGVLSLSLGVCAAVAALATWPEELRVRWLVDWEGPSDRAIITSGGTRMSPAMGHTLEDDAYWHPREPTRHLTALRCGYWRLQGLPDHAQPEELRHATRMLHAAAAGRAAHTLPWFALNDHPRDETPTRPAWLPGGTLAAHRAITRTLRALRDAR